jgi:hypothetical protein
MLGPVHVVLTFLFWSSAGDFAGAAPEKEARQPAPQQQLQQAEKERPAIPVLGELSKVWRVIFLRAEIVEDFWCGEQPSTHSSHAF